MYDSFLAVITQLAGQKKARVVVQGSVIFIETNPKKDCWSVSTRIFSGNGFIPPNVRECISSNGLMKWQERGAYLHMDPLDQSIYLVHEIHSAPKYVPFKYLMNDFVAVANEWREILEDFAERDHISLRLEPN
ncbi:MAG: hypothetical protein V4494_07900 [Chlamydiota bacterium]